MSTFEKNSEKYLRGVIELLHDVQLTPHDQGGTPPRAVDYTFVEGNRVGAVEVTTLQAEHESAWRKVLEANPTINCATTRSWVAYLDLSLKYRDIENQLPALVALCDEFNVDRPDDTPFERWKPHVTWYLNTGLRLRARHPDFPGEPGTIALCMPTLMGFVVESTEETNEMIRRTLESPLVATKIQKLADHNGATERHLAIASIGHHGTEFGILNQLLFEPAATVTLELPADSPLTHIWITAGTQTVLHWNRRDRWTWRKLPAPGHQEGGGTPTSSP